MHIYDNKLVITEIKAFDFQFDLPEYTDKNLKHKVDHIIRHNGFLAEEKMKNEIDQLLYKHKYGNYIHEHRKEQNQ